MSRIPGWVWGLLAVAVFGFVTMGAEAGGTVPLFPVLLLVPLVGLVVVRGTGRRGNALAERAWSGRTVLAGGPAATDLPVREVRSSGRVSRALGRAEARDLARSGAFGVGIGFCLLELGLFGFVWAGEDSSTWDHAVQLLPWFAHPLVGMCVLAGHRAITRVRRDGTDELFDSCPASAAVRTAGHLWTAVLPAVALVAFVAVLGLAVWFRSPDLHGRFGLDSAYDVLAVPVLGLGGVALGVAIGAWIRFSLAPVVAVVGIVFATTAINGIGRSDWNSYVGLSTAPTVEGPSPVFADRPAGWHVVWLMGLVAMVAAVALVRHRRDRAVVGIAGVGAVLALLGAIGVTAPMPGSSAEAIAHRIAQPEAHQTCTAVDAQVDVCAYRLHAELRVLVVDRIRPVVDALPRGLPPVTLRQRYDGELADLPPEVRRRLLPSDLRRPAGEVEMDFDAPVRGGGDGDPGFVLAVGALGLPGALGADRMPTVVAGQARGVVAIWLGARGLTPAQMERMSTSVAPASADAFERGSPELGDCAEPLLAWSAQDLAAARAVLALPADEVGEVVRRHWSRWADPATRTDDLLAALALPAVGPPDHVVAQPGNPC